MLMKLSLNLTLDFQLRIIKDLRISFLQLLLRNLGLGLKVPNRKKIRFLLFITID